MTAKRPDEISHERLLDIVEQIQQLLYLDMQGEREFWNPDKIWNPDTLDLICQVMDDYGLVPKEEDDERPET